MKILIYSLIFISLFSCDSEAVEAKNNLETKSLSEDQRKVIYDKLKYFHDETEIAIALIQNGKLSYYGLKRENSALKTIENKADVYEVGSISKVFTSTLLAEFVEAGTLALEDNINDSFNFAFKNDIKISFINLANHSSGLPRLPSSMIFNAIFNMDNPYVDFDDEAMKNYLVEDLDLDNPPGTKSVYSNLGAGLLGYTLGHISNMSYEEMLSEKITKKYAMNRTTTDKAKIQDYLVLGRDVDGDITPNWEFKAMAGAGAIFSSVEDLAKFTFAQFDSTNTALALTRKSTFEESENRHLGLGWVLFKRDNGDQWIWHNGGTGGYRSSMVLNTKNQNAVIILTNIASSHSKSNNIDRLGFDLMNSLFEFDKNLEPVAFLEGTWKVKGKKRYESWDIVAGNQMKGIGFKTEMGSNQIFENLSLAFEDDKLVYKATVVDQNDGKTISFIQNTTNTDYLSFENLSHDFPKKIQYKKLSEDEVEVRVLGENDKGLNYILIKQQ